MPKRLTFDHGRGVFTIIAHATGTPGIVAHKGKHVHESDGTVRPPWAGTRWTLTHEASGFVIASDLINLPVARDVAGRIGRLTDWTVPKEQIPVSAIGAEVRGIMASLG